MSIAQRVIVAHEGRLEIASRVGWGTTARAFVPAAKVPAGEAV
jgi:signal transduction histidine kinase